MIMNSSAQMQKSRLTAPSRTLSHGSPPSETFPDHLPIKSQSACCWYFPFDGRVAHEQASASVSSTFLQLRDFLLQASHCAPSACNITVCAIGLAGRNLQSPC